MKRRRLLKLFAVFFGLSLAFLTLELAVRIMGQSDPDGNFTFRSRMVPPYRLPTSQTRKTLARYSDSETRFATFLKYDPDLGWTVRPKARSADGAYFSSNLGCRAASLEDPDIGPKGKKLRILLFGDSFTHGDDVTHEESWAQVLERTLQSEGVDAEVLNFGVVAYGMDQALWRWEKIGAGLEPDIVVFGFQPENLGRNVNILRPLYYLSAAMPFTKPRFVVEDSGMRIVNRPTLPPEQILPTFEAIDSWPLRRYESYYEPSDYADPFYLKSKALSLLLEARRDANYRRSNSTKEERDAIALHVCRSFKASVEKAGARFAILHMPVRRHLRVLIEKRDGLDHKNLLAVLEKEQLLVDTSDELLAAAKSESIQALFYKYWHYSVRGNEIVGERLARDPAFLALAREAAQK